MAQNPLSSFTSLRFVLTKPARTNVVAFALSRFAAQDWLVASYLIALTVAVGMGDGPRRNSAALMLGADSLLFWTCLLLARSGRLRVIGDVLYRVGLIGAV